MQAVIDFLLGLADIVNSLVQFVTDFIGDLVYVVKLTGTFVLNIPVYFAWIPGAILSLIVTIFGIVVIYKVMGREG